MVRANLASVKSRHISACRYFSLPIFPNEVEVTVDGCVRLLPVPATEQPQAAGGNGDRLDGWKEIAVYVGKTIRTAQRWERELGMPIHRIPGTARDIVYALRTEIDAWRVTIETTKATTEPESQAPIEQTVRSSRYRWIVATVALFALSLLYLLLQSDGPPAHWRVVDDRLDVFDDQDRKLWEHRFEIPLLEAAYVDDAFPQKVSIQDLENDGRPELLFLTWGPEARYMNLYCFEHDGKVRFVYRPAEILTTSVVFGEKQYDPPFFLNQFIVGSHGSGKSIWVASLHHLWFPSVLQSLSNRGDIQSTYWSNGHITMLKEATISDTRLMLVGATNNEHHGASLAVLRHDSARGSSPAMDARFVCNSCGEGEPNLFLVFPRLDISAAMNTRPFVREVRLNRNEDMTVSVIHMGGPRGTPEEKLTSPVFYNFDSRFRIVGAELGVGYRHVHSILELAGKLDHKFSQTDETAVQPILSWDRTRFVPLTAR